MSWWKYGLGASVLVALAACGQAATGGTTDSANTAGSGSASPAASAGSSRSAASAASASVGTETASLQGGGAVRDQSSLIDALRARGYRVEEAGDVQQPFLQANGTTLRLSGGSLTEPVELQVFNYENAEAAQQDADQIGPDGNPLTMMITWVAPPHFFRAEQVIALYIGDNQDVIDLLTQVLGTSFAGQ